MKRLLLSSLAMLALVCGANLHAEDTAPAAAPAPATTEAAAPAATTAAPEAAQAKPKTAEERLAALEEKANAPLNSGDTAWMLVATVLVLLMTIPGLALFYGGLVRQKNALSVLIQCFAITCLVSILWTAYGYSMAFSTAGMEKGVINAASFFGSLTDKAFGHGITAASMTMTIPESIFFVFQLTFAVITPALIIGAFAERMKFSAVMLFTALWVTFVYFPICHMVWSGDGGLMWDWGVLDFAGGTVVHINAGIAGLVAAIMLGKRKGYPEMPMKPHSMTLSVVGAALLWCGWFGFNAGSAVAANGSAGMAMLVTHVATATAGFVWMVAEWIKHGKPSALGVISGAVAGLVAITPAAGTCGPVGAMVIGAAAAIGCFLFVTIIKRKTGIDDALDAFGVHGIGGIIGALLTGIFAADTLGGQKAVADLAGGSIGGQFMVQFKSVAFTVIYTGVITAILLFVVKALVGLRVSKEDEVGGLDLGEHDEEAYNHGN